MLRFVREYWIEIACVIFIAAIGYDAVSRGWARTAFISGFATAFVIALICFGEMIRTYREEQHD